jgi:hypothetical protein
VGGPVSLLCVAKWPWRRRQAPLEKGKGCTYTLADGSRTEIQGRIAASISVEALVRVGHDVPIPRAPF